MGKINDNIYRGQKATAKEKNLKIPDYTFQFSPTRDENLDLAGFSTNRSETPAIAFSRYFRFFANLKLESVEGKNPCRTQIWKEHRNQLVPNAQSMTRQKK